MLMNLNESNWDDLKFVLAVAEAGSVNSAARRIGVNHATVLRRIAQFEAALGHQIFDRGPSGYRPSRQGEMVVASAIRMRSELQALNESLNGLSDDFDGQITVTTTDSLLATVVGTALQSFQLRFPKISIELVITNRLLSLANRHADVAIRPTREAPDGMHAVRVCSLGFGMYASPDYIELNPATPDEMSRWLILNPRENKAPSQYWMQTHYPNAISAISAETYLALSTLAEKGLGIAVLPCCLGESSRYLVRIGDTLRDIETALWIMSPRDLAGTPPIRAFYQHFSKSLRQNEGLISGGRTLA